MEKILTSNVPVDTEPEKDIKVHITPLTKLRPETTCGVKALDAKYFQNRNCGFPII